MPHVKMHTYIYQATVNQLITLLMTDLYKKVSLHLFFFAALPCSMLAQFKGGTGSGYTYSQSTSQPLGRNIFTGGTDDGVNTAVALNQPLGRNIFAGGTDDGTSVAAALSQPFGRNIFLGGSDDGANVADALTQPLGRNIFTGGTDDGTNVSAALGQPLGRNIFLGGADDGWAMAFSSNLALPVTLSDFNGRWQLNDALLVWKTAMETNSAYFELERSFDGANFKNIHRTTAAGQSTAEKSYQYADVNVQKLLPPGNTSVYYRLRSIDKNGTGTYSAVVVLKAATVNGVEYAVFPNPAKDIITISASSVAPALETYIRFADANGKLLMLQKMTGNRQQVSVANYPSGIYYLQLLSANKIVYTQKIIIHK